MSAVNFFLGTHHADWLGRAGVPLFVSRRTLSTRKTLPRAIAPWALDSGGFTELSLHGRWTVSAAQYVRDVRRCRDEIGMLAWAAPQDWMCEPDMIRKTGLSVEEHQRRTVENFLELRALAPDLPICPVLQGWCMGDYDEHVAAYEDAGVDLRAEPIVGVGTMCRRQGMLRASCILSNLAGYHGLRIHAFGLKTKGLRSSADVLTSCDSLAWSFNARRSQPLAGHTHKSCANCLEYALLWRDQLLAGVPQGSA